MNQKPLLKICGITNLEDARYAAGAMVDYLGFIFYPDSQRYITPRDAAEIIGWIEGPEKVGVFVNQPAEEVNRTIDRTGIDLVQLHGDETPESAAKISRPVIKTFRIQENEDIARLTGRLEQWKEVATYFMFDAFDKDRYGGTGKKWDWSILSNLHTDTSYFLAGGISKENVAEAVSMVRPFAIDLSSNVEMSPGVKDFDKLESFFERWNEIREPDS